MTNSNEPTHMFQMDLQNVFKTICCMYVYKDANIMDLQLCWCKQYHNSETENNLNLFLLYIVFLSIIALPRLYK